MTLLLKQIFAFLKLLNSETGSHQIASGIACGFILGMSPALSLQTLLVFLIVFFFRVQFGAATLAAFFFKFVAYLLDPTFHEVGVKILTHPSLQAPLTKMYNMPLVPFTRFNNSIVMGAGITGLVLFPLVYVLSLILIKKYRETVLARFQKTKFWIGVKSTGLYKWYAKYDELYG